MKEKCFEIGTIQAFLDGELAPVLVEKVTHHVAVCDSCAALLAEAEEQSAFAFSALEQEFNTLVPTHRLWAKINDSIEQEKKPFWQTVLVFVSNIKSQISNQTVAAFASLLIVVGLFTSVLVLRNNDNSDFVAVNTPTKQNEVLPNSIPKAPNAPINDTAISSRESKSLQNPSTVNLKSAKKEFSAIKTTSVNKENNQLAVKTNSPRDKDRIVTPEDEPRTTNENLAGEESYIKTIATLTKTVDNRKDDVLKPSARFAFEKDLAVVDDAIKKMKREVKKNPKNEGAKQVLISSYQNKIDLLNSVAEKTELMASLR